MCTQTSPNEFAVCDVALPDVKAAVRELDSVRFVHRPYEATLVINDDPDTTAAFTPSVKAAIALQNG